MKADLDISAGSSANKPGAERSPSRTGEGEAEKKLRKKSVR
jgi:hypothetical protein